MINVSDEQTKAVFGLEERDMDVTIASTCSCNSPSQMFWFTPKEIYDEVIDETNRE